MWRSLVRIGREGDWTQTPQPHKNCCTSDSPLKCLFDTNETFTIAFSIPVLFSWYSWFGDKFYMKASTCQKNKKNEKRPTRNLLRVVIKRRRREGQLLPLVFTLVFNILLPEFTQEILNANVQMINWDLYKVRFLNIQCTLFFLR